MTKQRFNIDSCSMQNLQPDLSGNPFLRNLKFYLKGNRLQKRLGVEGGKAAQIVIQYLTNGAQRGNWF